MSGQAVESYFEDEHGSYFAPRKCPTCGADAGQRCRTSSDRPLRDSCHQPRWLEGTGEECEDYAERANAANKRARRERREGAPPRPAPSKLQQRVQVMLWALDTMGTTPDEARDVLERALKVRAIYDGK